MPTRSLKFNKSYASFGIRRSFWQVSHAIKERKHAERNMSALLTLLKQNEEIIERKLGKRVKNLRILEIGPGQGLERARYFGLHNEVDAMDLDVISSDSTTSTYLQMIKTNGIGRFVKTVGRRLLIGQANETAWAKAIKASKLKDPNMIQGNICQDSPQKKTYDLVVSWSVFEHLANPRQALTHIIQALKPGGIFFISLHLFTSVNGSHDIRAFSGQEDSVPLWGHLRQATQHQVIPSSFLNQWRLSQWRKLFFELEPPAEEYLNSYEHVDKYGPLLDTDLRNELKDYTDEELFTVDAIYAWRK